MNLINEIYCFFLKFSPSPKFLSDIAAIQAVLIAIAIPLSFEIVSRISERYQSEIITRRFTMNPVNRTLPVILVINIILAVSLRFFIGEGIDLSLEAVFPSGWKVLSWLTFLFFMVALFLFMGFINRLRTIMINPDKLLNEFYEEAENALK
jgi:hypothetical protein